MRVLILGVGDAFTYRGFGTSAVIQGPQGYVLLDCPDLVQRAMFEAATTAGWEVDVGHVDDIILTHLHGDHSNGLEAFGFARLVLRLQGQQKVLPRLHTHEGAAQRVWQKLAPAMDAPLRQGGGPAELKDYFDLRVFEVGKPFKVAGLTVQARYTHHPIPTVGLKISDGKRTLGWSGDTVFDQEHIDWLGDSDLIVHEANLGPVHTHVELLNALPEHLRRKMRITHIYDNFDPTSTDIRALSEGEVLDV